MGSQVEIKRVGLKWMDATEWGKFGVLPHYVRIWFFSRLHPYALAKLRVNNTLKTYIDADVRKNVWSELLSIDPWCGSVYSTQSHFTSYERNEWTVNCIMCWIDCKVLGGFYIRPDVHWRDVIVRWADSGKVVTVITRKQSPKTMGWCYRCILVNDNDPFSQFRVELA